MFYLPGNSIDVELHHVLPTGVILRFPFPVLRVDDTETHTEHEEMSVNSDFPVFITLSLWVANVGSVELFRSIQPTHPQKQCSAVSLWKQCLACLLHSGFLQELLNLNRFIMPHWRLWQNVHGIFFFRGIFIFLELKPSDMHFNADRQRTEKEKQDLCNVCSPDNKYGFKPWKHHKVPGDELLPPAPLVGRADGERCHEGTVGHDRLHKRRWANG